MQNYQNGAAVGDISPKRIYLVGPDAGHAAARILRFVRPTPLSPNSCILTLAGVTRVKLEIPLPALSDSNRMPYHPVQFYTAQHSKGITEPAAEAFRAAALRLVERLDADAKSRKGKLSIAEWRKLRTLIEEAETEKTPLISGNSFLLTPGITA